jgi:Ricin-type beta-trefoil lectin domain
MMRGTRRLAVALAASALVAAGGVTAGLVANAQTVAGTCKAPGADASCNVTETIASPSSILVSVSVTPAEQYPTYRYLMQCTLNGQTTTTSGNGAALTPYTQEIPLPFTVPDICTISVTALMPSAKPTNELTLTVEYTTGTPGNGPPPPGSEHVIKGFGGKCLDDRGNSSANRAAVIIWTCNTADPAQAWTYRGGELQHNGKCANDQGGGGSGSKVILWTCTRSANERWFHAGGNGEFILSGTTHGFLCLTDPGYSTRNGTQLIVSTCHNTSNQHWSLG